MAKKTRVGFCEYHGEYFMDDDNSECPSCQDGAFCENCGKPAEYDPDMILCKDCLEELEREDGDD
jgi:hypothetical protein